MESWFWTPSQAWRSGRNWFFFLGGGLPQVEKQKIWTEQNQHRKETQREEFWTKRKTEGNRIKHKWTETEKKRKEKQNNITQHKQTRNKWKINGRRKKTTEKKGHKACHCEKRRWNKTTEEKRKNKINKQRRSRFISADEYQGLGKNGAWLPKARCSLVNVLGVLFLVCFGTMHCHWDQHGRQALHVSSTHKTKANKLTRD